MARKTKEEPKDNVVEMMPQAAPAPEPEQGPAEVPTFMLRADCKPHLLAMVSVVELARVARVTSQELAELEAKLREFELYEEKYLR